MKFPLWFGPPERSLFALVSAPDDGRVSGAAVLCPPMSLEGVCARRTFATLADELAQAGILTLRFDYDGTGDSAGSDEDPDRVVAWLQGVQEAIHFVREAGAPKVAVLGMRLGATLAAAALSGATEPSVDGLVLWDPCVSGRAYLRAQRALHAFSLEESATDDGSVEAPGVVYSPETVEALSSLSLESVEGPLARRILVLRRESQSQGRRAVERFVSARPVELGVAEGQEDLVDVKPDAAKVPFSSVAAVRTWLCGNLAGDRVATSIRRRDEAVVGSGDAGPIVERILSLGPLGLFGILTEPQLVGDDSRHHGPTAIFLNAGSIDHTGPARQYVTLSRLWAAQGLRSLRCDLSGLGDSPARPGQPVDQWFPPEALEDVLEIAAAVSPADPSDVVLIGLCSGGYHAIEGALVLGAAGVCGINPVLPHKPGELRSETAALTEKTDERRQAAAARKWWVRALPAHDQLGPLLDRMPDSVWWVVNRVAVEQSPARVVAKLVEAGVRTLMVMGEFENRLMWRGERRARRQLQESGLLRLVVVPRVDHELLQRDARERVAKIVTEDVLGAYVRPWTKTVPGPAA